jgi:hypothetical protein
MFEQMDASASTDRNKQPIVGGPDASAVVRGSKRLMPRDFRRIGRSPRTLARQIA